MHAERVGPDTVAGGKAPPWTHEVRVSLSMHELSLSMPEPMLSLSMLILAKSGQARSKSWLSKVPQVQIMAEQSSGLVQKHQILSKIGR